MDLHNEKEKNTERTHHKTVNEEIIVLEGGECVRGDDSISGRFSQLHSAQQQQEGHEQSDVEDLHGYG